MFSSHFIVCQQMKVINWTDIVCTQSRNIKFSYSTKRRHILLYDSAMRIVLECANKPVESLVIAEYNGWGGLVKTLCPKLLCKLRS